ncbi:MAG: hypothetical protein A2V70_06240 [Planctomycetes bacterium RBG_13_63_9]|nr:MAG: hypothetical protein A2V70_06240 [Planctomycetes bacterium RBG_13_63_9]
MSTTKATGQVSITLPADTHELVIAGDGFPVSAVPIRGDAANTNAIGIQMAAGLPLLLVVSLPGEIRIVMPRPNEAPSWWARRN